MTVRPPAPTAKRFTGDSANIHRLVLDLRSGGIPARDPDSAVANRDLAELLRTRSPRLLPSTADSVFAPEPPAGGPGRPAVPFLPRERLLTPAEQRIAVECFARAVASGELTSGPAVARFEHALAEFVGLPHAVATSSGTDALVIALRAVGVGPDDEVIMPANSFAATENAVFACGAVPVLVDVDPGRHCLDPTLIEAAITPRTRAVLPVHLYGRLADAPGVRRVAREHGLRVVEDACQAIGVSGVGRYADATVLSFNPYKNFGLTGKAGAVLTGDSELHARMESLAYHGFAPGEKNVKTDLWGLNAKIDNSTATVATGLVPGLTLNNYRRAFLAHRYVEALAELGTAGQLELPAFTDDHSWHLFPVRVPAGEAARDALRVRLRESGIETDVYYPVLAHRHRTPLHEKLFGGVVLPRTEKLNATVFHLPLHNGLSVTEQDRVIEALHAAVHATGV
ncbi:DegT/DnrJ/EryC1/StrS family aminotransferase [Streptomyces sp. NPDC006175]|uniref:DegT/DnrJ/EryC1/StrS family aminotransferase n=1 Tax=Streptomyces sp. NPDC006175 TaxID=3154471 RepID=UPI0033A2F640